MIEPDIQGDRLFRVIEIDGTGRTEFFTGPAFSLLQINTVVRIDGVFQGYGLGVWHIDGLAFDQLFVVNVIYFFGTFFCTYAAGDAFVHVHIAGMLDNGYGKIAFFSRNVFQFRQGEQFDVDMPADLDQFGGDNSHGAVVGGKGLVQLGHGPADCG